MKVSIDCDKRVKFRGSKEYEGGWYYYKTPPKGQPYDKEFETQKCRERFETYAECRAAAKSKGHEVDSGGWKHKMLSWNFTSHSLDDYPGWETITGESGRPTPAGFVKLAHVRGKSGGEVESNMICNAWDDVAGVDFYQRDWTDDGIPFVSDGTTYWSGWWFATAAERDRFVAWQAEHWRKLGTP